MTQAIYKILSTLLKLNVDGNELRRTENARRNIEVYNSKGVGKVVESEGREICKASPEVKHQLQLLSYTFQPLESSLTSSE